ncbi:hypothetical protein ASG22_07645 [Chryseobacterium sp. Leaf405]|uniref:bacteriocin-like protein n=1 Tax=Chryseobacterium sp. Leaf405 TaxID=1736367 RepID=UPI0006FA8126|nr:hypothetical protein [Chryseobacterium sp. Leaf405]KQT23890.1 hypothetical protein ASG22_07645 [Chryseobacterium sp. Leaf405]
MKNLKKLNRSNLKTIQEGAGDDCQIDLDCGPAGCAWCTDFKGRKICLVSSNYPFCQDINP